MMIGSQHLKNYLKKGDVTYNFKNNSTFEIRNIKSVYYVSETISFLGNSQKFENFCQVTLKIQKIKASSNKITAKKMKFFL